MKNMVSSCFGSWPQWVLCDRTVYELRNHTFPTHHHCLSGTEREDELLLKFKIFLSFLALQPNSDLGHLHGTFRFTSVTRSRSVGRTPWTGDQLVARPLPVHKHRKTHTTQTFNIHPWVGFEPTVPASARAKTIHALDCSATVTGEI
jgi:hypothetical protein